MDTTEFDKRLRELEAMTGQDVTMDLFNEAYEGLLNDVSTLPGSRYQKLGKMRALVYRQFMFLHRRWREEKGSAQKNETEEIVQ